MGLRKTELTGRQHEIVKLLWEGKTPRTVTEIWQALGQKDARTTVLTWVQRLERRGWLVRSVSEEGLHYSATRAPEEAAADTAMRIVDTLFSGSPTQLVMALAGRGRITPEEVARLRGLVDALEDGHAE